ncbi:hypothetical protein HDV00_009843 [Rhizophlyctis rosea]|nr:hypothetical protein HDV00_009843 [Rhizophlyctis rosea]
MWGQRDMLLDAGVDVSGVSGTPGDKALVDEMRRGDVALVISESVAGGRKAEAKVAEEDGKAVFAAASAGRIDMVEALATAGLTEVGNREEHAWCEGLEEGINRGVYSAVTEGHHEIVRLLVETSKNLHPYFDVKAMRDLGK